MKNLISKLQGVQNFLADGVYDVVGVEAENFHRQSFDKEGFTDKAFKKWENVNRRTNPGRTARAKTLAGRPILTQSGDLKESIRYAKKPPYVVIHSDKEYAQVHNEGGSAGRTGRQFTMKQRQFIGKSETLNSIITDKITQRLKSIK